MQEKGGGTTLSFACMNDELDASVTETDPTQTSPVDATPDLSAGGETVTETPAAAAVPEATTESAPAMRGLLEVMRERGYATQHEDDAAALDELIRRAQRAQQYEPYVQHLQSNWSGYQQYLASQQKPAVPSQPAEAPKSYWDKLPEYDPGWLNMVTRNEQGQLVAVPGAQPDLPQKIQAYTRAREAALSKLLADPVAATWGGFEEKLNALLEQREQQLSQRIFSDMQARQYLRDNAANLFQVDANGQYLRDPATGSPAFSAYGQAFAAYINQAEQLGLNPQVRKVYAENMARAYVAQQQPQQAQQVQQQTQNANEQHKAAYTNGAKRIPNRGGTVNTAGASDSVKQNGSHDLRDMLYADFRRAGLIDATAT